MGEPSESIVTLTTAPNEAVAGIIVAALEREGIKATMSGTASAEFRVGVPEDVEIYVARKDLEWAQRILDEADYEAEDDEE
jgi:hypothetical protein